MSDTLWEGFGTEPDHPYDEQRDVTLRQSTVSSMDLCPGRVGHALDPGFRDQPSEAMAFGTLVHTLIEDHLTSSSPDFRLISAESVLKVWRQVLAAEGHDLDVLSGEVDVRESAKEASSAFLLWHDWWKAAAVPLPASAQVEGKVWRPLGQLPNGRGVWLHGTPDVWTPEGGWDWKTSGSGWKEGKLHFHPQPTAYTWLLSPLRDGSLHMDWSYLVYDRRRQEWVRHDTSRGPAEVNAWVRHAWMRAKQIDAQAFPYTPTVTVFGKTERGWWCSAKYCGAWDVCPGKWLADGVDETSLAVVDWDG